MLIKFAEIKRKYSNIKGILHIGAHTCEELRDYTSNGVPIQKIIWVEANPELVQKIKANKNIRIIQACVADQDDQEVTFQITNNFQSSSILNLKEHLKRFSVE